MPAPLAGNLSLPLNDGFSFAPIDSLSPSRELVMRHRSRFPHRADDSEGRGGFSSNNEDRPMRVCDRAITGTVNAVRPYSGHACRTGIFPDRLEGKE
jgi:hypothetical protein